MRGFPALRSAAAACPHTLLRGDAPNLARILLGEPEGLAIRPGGDALRSALGCRDAKKSGEAATGCDAPDLVPTPIQLREPEVAIGPGGDASKPTAKRGGPTGRWQGELGDTACRGDAPDLVRKVFGEPQIAIRPGGDALGAAIGRGDGESGEAAPGGDAPDVVRTVSGEPEVAIWPGRKARYWLWGWGTR